MLVQQQKFERKQLLKSFLTNASFEEVVASIVYWAKDRLSTYVCLTNVHMLVEAYQNPSFNQIVNEADLTLPDGKPLAVMMNLLYKTRQKQIAGMDLTLGVLKAAEENKLSVFFWADRRKFSIK